MAKGKKADKGVSGKDSEISKAEGSTTSGNKPKGKKGKGKKRALTPPAAEELEEWVPPPHSLLRYDSVEMLLVRMELAMNHARVLVEAWRRWDVKPEPGPVPPPPPPKDPLRAQLEAVAEHQRRLGSAAKIDRRPEGEAGVPPTASTDIKKKEEKEAAPPLMAMEISDEEEKPTIVPEAKQEPCEILQEPCRRLFTAPCRPCPEHTPGVPRDPKKVCTCTMTPRPESRRDALRFLSYMPRELNATFSSLDPARIQEEQQRKKAEEKWKRVMEEKQEVFERAMRRARALMESQEPMSRPPFVAEHTGLTTARGISTVGVPYVCEPRVCKV